MWCSHTHKFYIKNANVELLDEGPPSRMNEEKGSSSSSISNHQFLSAFSGNNVLMLCKLTNARTHTRQRTKLDKVSTNSIDIFDLVVPRLEFGHEYEHELVC